MRQNTSQYLPAISLGLGIILVAASLFDANVRLQRPQTNAMQADADVSGDSKVPDTPKPDYKDILRLHLFGEEIQEELIEDTPLGEAAVPETQLNMELIGIIHHSIRDKGQAIIAIQGRPHKIYKLGDTLPGEAVVKAIDSDRILIIRNSRPESLSLKKPGRANEPLLADQPQSIDTTSPSLALSMPPPALNRTNPRRAMLNKPR